MKSKQQLLKLVQEKDWDSLPSLIKANGRAALRKQSELQEALGELSRSEQDLIWGSIVDLFVQYISKYFEKEDIPQSCNETSQDHVTEDEEEKVILLFEALFALGIVQVNSLVDQKNASTTPKKLIRFIVLVGGLLNVFNEPVHEAATVLCENWINGEFERASDILADTLLAVIEICLKPNAKKVDVKRAWNLHRGLNDVAKRLNTGEAESQNAIRKLLLKCPESPVFLGCEEGVKFLSLVFAIPSLVAPFHSVVKSALPTAPKCHCEKYAEIYFRVWKNSEEELKKNLEENCLQDLMYLAIHADPFASRLSSNLFVFLHHIHKHKKHLPTASVIYSLYEPFLWRSLKVANGYVRTNAAAILCDVYPCTDHTLSDDERVELMEQQYQAFLILLVDPCHLVRIATVKGVFVILRNYWLLIPPHVIKQMFQIFLKKLLVDASSAEIRKLVVQGMTSLLDCSDAGPFMTSVLPNISGAFDDINSSVRVAFIKLLLRVKATRFIKYWKLVSMEHLLNRLAVDISDVRTLITQLIHSSFLSPHLEEKEIVTRCISLIELNRDGARRFYQHASKKFDVESATRVILFIWRTLHRYIVRTNSLQGSFSHSGEDGTESSSNVSSPARPISTKKQKRASNRSRNKENKAPATAHGTEDSPKSNNGSKDENEETSEMPLDNPNIVGGLLDTIVILWAMKAPRLSLPENVKYLEALRTRISRTFPIVWSFFKENDDISKALVYLSSFLPKSHVPTMVGLCLSRLKLVQEREEIDNNYVTYVNALCNWNRADDIMELISEWIDGAFSSAMEPSNRRISKRANKRVCFEEKDQPKPRVALCFLNHLLFHPLNKISLLESNRNLLVQLCHQMAPVQNLVEKRILRNKEPLSPLCSDRFLSSCFGDYLCVVSLLNHAPPEPELPQDSGTRATRRNSSCSTATDEIEPFDALAVFKDYACWMGRLLSDMDHHPSFDSSFFFSCAAVFLKAGLNLVAIGIADEQFLNQYLEFTENYLQKAPLDVDVWCLALRGISQAHDYWSAYGDGRSHRTPSSSASFRCFSAVLTSLTDKTETLSSIDQNKLNEFSESICLTVIGLSENCELMLTALSEFVVKLSLDSIVNHLNENEDDPQTERVKDLWAEAFIFVSSMHRRAKLVYPFLDCLTEGIASAKHIDYLLAGVWLLSLLWRDAGKASQHSLKCAMKKAIETVENVDPPTTPSEEVPMHTPERKNFQTFRKLQELVNNFKASLLPSI